MRFPILVFLFLFTTYYILHITYYIPIAWAQAAAGSCSSSSNPRIQKGLLTTPSLSGNFGIDSNSKCINSNQTAFAPFKIPSYADLKSLYYTQSKQSTHTSLPATFSGDGIYYINSDLTISSASSLPSGSGTQVIFLDKGIAADNTVTPANLNVNQDVTYSANNGGLVFVVSGNVNIDPSVKEIDAVIISFGIIRTAGSTCTQNSYDASATGALTVNGSLISLSSNNSPVFCRKLTSTNNSSPAEVVNWQPKYLVILRDLFSDTLQKWSEIQ